MLFFGRYCDGTFPPESTGSLLKVIFKKSKIIIIKNYKYFANFVNYPDKGKGITEKFPSSSKREEINRGITLKVGRG